MVSWSPTEEFKFCNKNRPSQHAFPPKSIQFLIGSRVASVLAIPIGVPAPGIRGVYLSWSSALLVHEIFWHLSASSYTSGSPNISFILFITFQIATVSAIHLWTTSRQFYFRQLVPALDTNLIPCRKNNISWNYLLGYYLESRVTRNH